MKEMKTKKKHVKKGNKSEKKTTREESYSVLKKKILFKKKVNFG